MRTYYYLLILIFGFVSCTENKSYTQQQKSQNSKNVHFTIEENGDQKIITVINPFVGGDISERYLLYPKGKQIDSIEGITHYIEIPVNKIAINSTTFLGYINALDASDKINAASNLKLFYHDDFKRRIKRGEIQSIGDREINQEQLVNAESELLFTFAVDGSGLKEVNQLRRLGQKVILVAEFMEQKPLDKANWLKFFAAFLDKKEQANIILTKIEKDYLKTKNEASLLSYRPKVMVGLPWKGSWFVSGGESFQANYFEAANANYVWKDKKQEGGVSLTFETVLKDALDSDFWINPGIINSKKELIDKDNRFKNFMPFQKQTIYTNFKRSNTLGANDYWESGVVRADLVLKDLVSIFHPELYPDYQLTYYKEVADEN